jgi:MtrB/PioB family decaheme-associated outer membrane protein
MMRSKVLGAMAAVLLTSALTVQAQSQSSPSPELYEPANPNAFGQVDFGGRFTSVSGDEARYQRYRDLRDGVFVDIPAYHRETERWWVDSEIHNVGYRDQQYLFSAAMPGKARFHFIYDQIPTYISRDTRTPYSPLPQDNGVFDNFGGAFTLPDGVQQAIQAATPQDTHRIPSGLVRLSLESLAANGDFFTRLRRDTLGFDLAYSFLPDWTASVRYKNTKKEGDIPYGASFGFNLAVEVPLPIDQRTNDFGAAIEWANARGMFRAGYDGSWFDNKEQVFEWDNPLRFTDTTYSNAYSTGDGTSRGRMTTWPTNSLNYFNVAGLVKLARRTNVNGTFAYGWWDQNESLVAHTINTAISPIPLERTSAEAKANTGSATLNFVTRPWRDFGIDARYRYYQFDNKTPHFEIFRPEDPEQEYVRFDQVPEPFSNPEIDKLGPEFFGYTRNYFDLDATWSGLPFSAVKVGFGYYDISEKFRVYEDATDKLFRIAYDVTGNQWISFRSLYEYSQRRGSSIEDINVNASPDVLEAAGEQPGMRHYDIADRDRNRFTLIANVNPIAILGVSGSVFWNKDEYKNPEQTAVNSFGLLEYQSKGYSIGFDVVPREAVSFGASYEWEKYDGTQQSRNASPGVQFTDPTRNWGVDEEQKARNFILNLDLIKLIPQADVRFYYDYSKYDGSYFYTLAGGYKPTPADPIGVAQLPDLSNEMNRFTTDFRYWIRKNIAIGFMYWFEKYQVTDWAFSPDLLSGVAVPPVDPEQGTIPAVTGILLDYLYRPYTAHSGWVRLTYLF